MALRKILCLVLTALGIIVPSPSCRGRAAETVDKSVPEFVFACRADNDLYRVLSAAGKIYPRFETAAEAVRAARAGAGVLALADGYPARTTVIEPAVLEAAAGKGLRLYIEYPAALPGRRIGQPQHVEWERAVVASDVFGPDLPRMRILMIHDCHFTPVDADRRHLVLARVAGYDTAPFGLPKETWPALFEYQPGVLVATTKLSQFVTARYGPEDAWRAVWRMILGELQPERSIPEIKWVPTVRPTYDRQTPLPADAWDKAIIRGIDWHTNARMLIHKSWRAVYDQYGGKYPPIGPRPDDKLPAGDGEQGVLEGFTSRIRADGSQDIRWWLRSDSNGETSLAFALRAKLDGDPRSRRIAANLLDWVYLTSGLMHNDPKSPAYGLLGWAPSHPGVYYGDNDVKAILGYIGTSGILPSDRWDEVVLRNILANFRTTGRYGFRGACLDDAALQRNGWQHYWGAGTVHYAPHYEAWIWATYLWLYDKTHFPPLLEKTKTGIRRMMAAYPAEWRWTNGIQQERARMLLPLAWLVRVDDTPEHRQWLRRIADDLLAGQQPCGAFQEEIGAIALGTLRPPQSNEEYGTHEASLIQTNGDPAADLLYTSNFAMLGLVEAAAATGDRRLAEAADRLGEFFVRVQVHSQSHPELDGAWFRGFDFRRWEYWASNSDWEWGPWRTEVGWTEGWVVSGLALRRLNLNLWDLSKDSKIGRHMEKHRPMLLPDAVLAAPPGGPRLRHAAVGARVVLARPPDPRYPGGGAAALTDGEAATADFQDPAWLGFFGDDLEAVIDLGAPVAIEKLGLRCLQSTAVGIFLPKQVEFAVSGDGKEFRVLKQVVPDLSPREPGPTIRTLSASGLQTTARYIRLRATNLGMMPEWTGKPQVKAWLFADEVPVNPQ